MTLRTPTPRPPRWPQAMPGWASAVAVAALLFGAWVVVYAGGGTHTALPHMFYLPIVLAVVPFGGVGGLAASVAATLLCGPLMPLDVAAGEPQQVANWLTRGVFFVAVGVATGVVVNSLRRSYEHGLSERIRHDVGIEPDGAARLDASAAARIGNMLAQRGFHPVYQPIYDLRDGHLLAVEALTRFAGEPQQPPNVWFDQAAQLGLGPDLELAAIDKALATSATQLPPDVAVAVNSSPHTLADPRLMRLLDHHRHRKIIVEVTEHAVIDDYRLLQTVRDQLRSRGVRLAVDDAGAGFASLRHIVRLAPEYIKLDPTLIQDLRLDPVRQALASSLIQFANQTDSQLIAEGIENPLDLHACRELGVHAAQGYLLARPGPLPAPAIFDLGQARTTRHPQVATAGR